MTIWMIVFGMILLLILAILIGSQLDTEQTRRAHRRVAAERRRLHAERRAQHPSADTLTDLDHDDEDD